MCIRDSQIGADRLANAVGAAAYYGYPCVVVDFGTAGTFDVIGPQCTYMGGVIAPVSYTHLDVYKRQGILCHGH